MFLRPLLPSSEAAGTAEESADAATSCGSSPARSHNVSTLTPGAPNPTKTYEMLTSKLSPPVASPSEKERELAGDKAKTGDKDKELETIQAVTPAASLIEAYKRREREREEQRIVIERVKEGQLQQLLQGEGFEGDCWIDAYDWDGYVYTYERAPAARS